MKPLMRNCVGLLVMVASTAALAGQYWYLEKQETLKNGELRCTYYTGAVVNGRYTIKHLTKTESGSCASKIWVD